MSLRIKTSSPAASLHWLTIAALGLSLPALVGCGGVGSADAPLFLTSAGVPATVSLPTGGKLTSTGSGASVKWASFSWAATFELNSQRLVAKKTTLAQDASGAFAVDVPVSIAGQAYTCSARAKTHAVAERLSAACDTLAAAASASAAGSAMSVVIAGAGVELEERSVPEIGCRIKIPKGAETLMEDNTMATFSLALQGGVFELDTSVLHGGAQTIDDAKRYATLAAQTITSAKTLPNGMFEVLSDVQMKTQTVFVYSPAHTAKCEGPPEYLAKLSEMCESLSDGVRAAPAKTPLVAPKSVDHRRVVP